MSYKYILLAASAAALVACTASSDELTPVVAGTTTMCPEDKVLALSDYPDEVLVDKEDTGEWLMENAKRRDITVKPSGLQYATVQAGLKDGAVADTGETIIAHYHGYFANGEKFDSSYDRGQPLVGPSNGFIKGWNESLAEMQVCEARILYIPYELAYGPAGRGSIPPATPLVFRMQLLGIDR